MNYLISINAHHSYDSGSGPDTTPVLINASVSKLYEIWTTDYVGKLFIKGEQGVEKISKLIRATDQIKNFNEIWAPVIDLKTADPTGLTFADGRHTFIALKLNGYSCIKIVVPTSKAKILEDALSCETQPA
ncbi:MAG: hypothetical protein Q7U63_12055 [Polaromonas sp.]|uniref:hypothetical protein n=1 Tax=Polaromonas sp. TaxID=1869339 RepID=UPI0027246B89|nr:hypothetical protein [Polaromonas sp.]MDO9114510.1 hypothetical protein [Polaromonas sp.]